VQRFRAEDRVVPAQIGIAQCNGQDGLKLPVVDQ
jgi:hypothetical protein